MAWICIFAATHLGIATAAGVGGWAIGWHRRQFSDAQLINYGYHLGWNEGISMTEIPGAEIVDLTTGTKRVVPEK